MSKDYNILKKNYGEKFAQLCRKLFPTLLDKEDLLSNIILSKFSPNHFLCDDIIDEMMEEEFKNYIYSFVDVEKKEIEINKSVKELLSDAGYNFYECKSEEDIQSFKKYYAKGEELCTFNGGRLDKCYVFWAIKKDVDQIKREDYKHPTREDEYGTSVISIQFTKQGHTLSIKNRYNHHVNNPDATYSNNLDNIVPGLTNAFKREYSFHINQNKKNSLDLPNYVLADDGKWYKYNYEINNKYYCPDNIIIDNGQVKQYDKNRYIIIDYFIIDMKEKKVKLFDNIIKDCFSKTLLNIEKINILKTTEGKSIIIKLAGKEDIIIKISKLNKIISLYDKNIEEINDYYLQFSNISKINLPSLRIVGDNFLAEAKIEKELYLPKLEQAGDNFLVDNQNLIKLNLPKLKVVRNMFLSENETIEEVNLPNLEKVGKYFMSDNQGLTKLYLPKLKESNYGFISRNETIEEVNLTNLEKVGEFFMCCNIRLTKISLPELKEIDFGFLENNMVIEEINLPNIKEDSLLFIENKKIIKIINRQKLEQGNNYKIKAKINNQ